MSKELVLNKLKSLVIQYKVEKKNSFKIKALSKAVAGISMYDGDEIVSGKQAMKEIEGVGKGIAKRIDEIIETGTLAELNTDTMAKSVLVDKFCSIHGIGIVRAKKFVELGYKTFDDIVAGADRGEIKLNHDILIGLKYYEDFQKRIPRNEIDAIRDFITEAVPVEDVVFEICGSYRRGAETSGDIDILMMNRDPEDEESKLKDIVGLLTEKGFLIDHLTEKGDKKYMGVCRLAELARRIDIRYVISYEYYPALIYFTGSKNFNIKIRHKAIELGYSLSEYGFKKHGSDELITTTSEEEIFEILELDYVKPTDREMGK